MDELERAYGELGDGDGNMVMDPMSTGNTEGAREGLGAGETVEMGLCVGTNALVVVDGFGECIGFSDGVPIEGLIVGSFVGVGVSYENRLEVMITSEKVPFARLYCDGPNLSDIHQIGTSSPR